MLNSVVPPTLLAGGGSAGHVSPLLAIADAMRRRDPHVRIGALGTAAGMESRLVPMRGYELFTCPKVPFPRKPSLDALKTPARLWEAVQAAHTAIDAVGAKVVVGMGGYVSAPAYLAAKRAGVPIVIHEQNALPGMANKLGARFTSHVGVTFPDTPLRGGRVVGMPLRAEITSIDREALRSEAREFFKLPADGPVLLVTGGSLGAAAINEAVQGAAPALEAAGISVLHITGRGKAEGIAARDGDAPYRVVEYVDRMDLAYAAADFVLCRSGANTVCEITAVGLGACYVPLPIGNGEQRRNAEPVRECGGGMIVDNADLTPQWIEAHLLDVLTDSARLRSMGEAAATWGARDADEKMVDMIIAAAGE